MEMIVSVFNKNLMHIEAAMVVDNPYVRLESVGTG